MGLEDGTELCHRCAAEIAPGQGELCIWDEGPLCRECWDRFGYCNDPAAVKMQEDLAKATTPAERVAIMARPGPIGNTHAKLPKH